MKTYLVIKRVWGMPDIYIKQRAANPYRAAELAARKLFEWYPELVPDNDDYGVELDVVDYRTDVLVAKVEVFRDGTVRDVRFVMRSK